jgi:hypothetical protein
MQAEVGNLRRSAGIFFVIDDLSRGHKRNSCGAAAFNGHKHTFRGMGSHESSAEKIWRGE